MLLVVTLNQELQRCELDLLHVQSSLVTVVTRKLEFCKKQVDLPNFAIQLEAEISGIGSQIFENFWEYSDTNARANLSFYSFQMLRYSNASFYTNI